MIRFKYLIIGGGMTADSAAKGIRSVDGEGSIGIVGAETDPPYDRPPLSKGLWKGKPLESVWRDTEARGINLFSGRRAVALDPGKQMITDDQGASYGYEKLLLATGGAPRRHQADESVPIYYRTLEDYRRLRALTEQKKQFVVVGGGFIGSEIAAALAMNGKSVAMAFFESGLCGSLLPPELSALLNRRFHEKGVRVIAGRGVTSIRPVGSGAEVSLEDGSRLAGDAVVAGLGIAPNTQLAAQAGLSIDNGIVVDEHLRTSGESIYAAGDVACFPCAAVQRRVRLEHEDNANAMGAMAGRNMAGGGESYNYLPYFYSDLFDIGYEAIGETTPTGSTVTVWLEPEQTCAVFYMRDDQVRGVLMWNLSGKLDAARELIASPGPYRAEDLRAWAGERLVQ